MHHEVDKLHKTCEGESDCRNDAEYEQQSALLEPLLSPGLCGHDAVAMKERTLSLGCRLGVPVEELRFFVLQVMTIHAAIVSTARCFIDPRYAGWKPHARSLA